MTLSTNEKIMLIMYIAHKEGVGDYFSVNDIIFITSKIFNEKLTRDQISSCLRKGNWARYFDENV